MFTIRSEKKSRSNAHAPQCRGARVLNISFPIFDVVDRSFDQRPARGVDSRRKPQMASCVGPADQNLMVARNFTPAPQHIARHQPCAGPTAQDIRRLSRCFFIPKPSPSPRRLRMTPCSETDAQRRSRAGKPRSPPSAQCSNRRLHAFVAAWEAVEAQS